MEQGRTIYNNKGFEILEYPRYRDYLEYPNRLNDEDKRYKIKITGENQPTFEDINKILFYLLSNKVLDGAFIIYKNKILETVDDAEFERIKRKEQYHQKNLEAWQ